VSDPYAPHMIVALITYEIHQKLESGEASGKVVGTGKKVVKVEGFNLEDCQQKFTRFLESANG